jgi:hypothetical protein
MSPDAVKDWNLARKHLVKISTKQNRLLERFPESHYHEDCGRVRYALIAKAFDKMNSAKQQANSVEVHSSKQVVQSLKRPAPHHSPMETKDGEKVYAELEDKVENSKSKAPKKKTKYVLRGIGESTTNVDYRSLDTNLPRKIPPYIIHQKVSYMSSDLEVVLKIMKKAIRASAKTLSITPEFVKTDEVAQVFRNGSPCIIARSSKSDECKIAWVLYK